MKMRLQNNLKEPFESPRQYRTTSQKNYSRSNRDIQVFKSSESLRSRSILSPNEKKHPDIHVSREDLEDPELQ